jgi:hypothetical protein
MRHIAHSVLLEDGANVATQGNKISAPLHVAAMQFNSPCARGAGKSVPMAQLGSAVHKPPTITSKLGAWLKSKPAVFKVDAANSVSLA